MATDKLIKIRKIFIGLPPECEKSAGASAAAVSVRQRCARRWRPATAPASDATKVSQSLLELPCSRHCEVLN